MPTLTSEEFKKGLAGLGDGLRETIKENNRDLVKHFTDLHHAHTKRFDRVDHRLGQMDERFDQVDAKLEAIIEMLAMRKEVHNLVRELRAQGISLDETKIFIA